MNWVDIVVIAVIALTAIIGLSRGLFESLLSLISTSLSIFLAILAAKPVAKFLNKVIRLDELFLKLLNNESGVLTIFGKEFTTEKVAAFCSVVASMIIVWVLIKVAIWLLSKLFDSATSNSGAISGMNRVLGLFFGIVKGVVIVGCGLAIIACLKVLPFVGDKLEGPINEASFTRKVYVYIDEFVEDKMEDRIENVMKNLTEEPEEAPAETPAETPETPAEGEGD